jgi:hypothetical protein
MSGHMQFYNDKGQLVAEYDKGVLKLAPLSAPVSVIEQSPQGYVGLTMIDVRLRKWTIVNRAVHVDGVPYHWGVADDYLMWDDIVYLHNLALSAPNQYVHELTDATGNHTGWSQPLPDPRVAPVAPPVTDTLCTRGSITGNVLTVQSSTGFKVGDPVILPATQGRGKRGPGGHYPSRLFNTEQEMRNALGSIPEGSLVGTLDSGVTFAKMSGALEHMIGMGYWYLGHIAPRAYFATIQKIEGTRWTMSKAALFTVNDVDVFYDGSKRMLDAVQQAPDGATVNANAVFPGWRRVAINGMLAWFDKRVTLTCDKEGSFELFSPPGTPCIGIHWRRGAGILSNFITLRGNWGDDNYGFNWEGTSTGVTGYHGFLTDLNPFSPAVYPSCHEFFGTDDGRHQDATMVNVPNRATGGESTANCWSDRIKGVYTMVLRQYIQWQMQYGSTRSKCGTRDCSIDSVALIPGFESMHGDADIIRPSGRNFTMAMNNASGTIDSPRIRLEPDCVKPLEGYPAWFQYATGAGYGAPCMNLNKNAGNWAVGKGITLINPKIDQPGYLDSNGCNMPAVAVAELPNFKLAGLQAAFPATRVTDPKYGPGAVGLQCYGVQAFIDGHVKVSGACQNSGNAFMVFVTQGTKGPNLNLDVPPGGVSFNWAISTTMAYDGPYEAGRPYLDLLKRLREAKG